MDAEWPGPAPCRQEGFDRDRRSADWAVEASREWRRDSIVIEERIDRRRFSREDSRRGVHERVHHMAWSSRSRSISDLRWIVSWNGEDGAGARILAQTSHLPWRFLGGTS